MSKIVYFSVHVPELTDQQIEQSILWSCRDLDRNLEWKEIEPDNGRRFLVSAA